MNWSYISGFFDADGSVSLIRQASNRNRSPQISFHNNELVILESIREFIYSETGVLGYICKKKRSKPNHNQAYDLKYSELSKCLPLIEKMVLYHPVKKERFTLIFKIKDLTPRNGKYTKQVITDRSLVEEYFISLNKRGIVSN